VSEIIEPNPPAQLKIRGMLGDPQGGVRARDEARPATACSIAAACRYERGGYEGCKHGSDGGRGLERRAITNGAVHYKRSLNRKRMSRCLDARTLAALAGGTMPSDEVRHVREHLPQCSKCLGKVAAASRQRALDGPAGSGRESARVPPGAESSPGRLLRGLAVAISLLALGSSVTCWYLDPGVPGKGRSNEGMLPSGVPGGPMTAVE
jgi:hypothetical protein